MWACEMAKVPKPQIKQTKKDFIHNKLQCIYMFQNLDLKRGIKNPFSYYNKSKNQSSRFLNLNFLLLHHLSFLLLNFVILVKSKL